jgi:segregation and condensation protein B
MALIALDLLIQIIEGALLAAGQPLSISRLQGLFDEDERPSEAEIQASIEQLIEQYEGRGIELKLVASGYRFQIREHISPWVSNLWEERPPRYSRALLETLAIVAYQQPVTRGEIEDIRGVVVSTSIIRTLQDREWVQVVGYRDAPGRPAMYATTRQFLDYFNLSSLNELPPLADVKSLAASELCLDEHEEVPEGQYDLSRAVLESTDGSELLSAQQDIEKAEAIVAQVEENLFKKKAEQLEQQQQQSQEQLQEVEGVVDTVDIDIADVDKDNRMALESDLEKAQADSTMVNSDNLSEIPSSQSEADGSLSDKAETAASFADLLNRLSEPKATHDPDDDAK